MTPDKIERTRKALADYLAKPACLDFREPFILPLDFAIHSANELLGIETKPGELKEITEPQDEDSLPPVTNNREVLFAILPAPLNSFYTEEIIYSAHTERRTQIERILTEITKDEEGAEVADLFRFLVSLHEFLENGNLIPRNLILNAIKYLEKEFNNYEKDYDRNAEIAGEPEAQTIIDQAAVIMIGLNVAYYRNKQKPDDEIIQILFEHINERVIIPFAEDDIAEYGTSLLQALRTKSKSSSTKIFRASLEERLAADEQKVAKSADHYEEKSIYFIDLSIKFREISIELKKLCIELGISDRYR